ncbi:erythromycin esterase family protein [Pedobacter lithocola]|uniref:Erythromycin esterase family protein n=1 Tax=Pedobacter lithocola TaxID=1908239 RepID=A0ABV8PFG0_9SPHI
MKLQHLKAVVLIASALLISFKGKSQHTEPSSAQLRQTIPFSMRDYKSFRASMKSQVKEMALKQIVGLGEGTHGTAEFYRVRYYITRMLIEDFGFNHVAFENDVTEVWQFNKQLKETTDINSLMKKYLLTLWQNEETKQLFTWIKNFNAKRKNKVSIDGIDYPSQLPDVEMISELLSSLNEATFSAALENLREAATLQDDAWSGMNKAGYKSDWKLLGRLVKNGYLTADSLEKIFQQKKWNSDTKQGLLLAIANLKQGFEPFYRRLPEAARDSIMAHNVIKLAKSSQDKIVIWAHNAHLGKTGIYGNVVGGTGGYILKTLPNSYFVLGTATAEGTFGGTTDARAINNSPIKPYKLEKPIAGSWEEYLSGGRTSNFYLKTDNFNPAKVEKPLRFVGYGIKSGASSYDKTNLSDLFDALLFLKITHAPTPLR